MVLLQIAPACGKNRRLYQRSPSGRPVSGYYGENSAAPLGAFRRDYPREHGKRLVCVHAPSVDIVFNHVGFHARNDTIFAATAQAGPPTSDEG